MRLQYILIALLIIYACSEKQEKKNETQKVIKKEFQVLLDSANVNGSILVFDPQSNIAYSNDFARCDKGFLPASTFKIINSIIALETGVVADDSTIFKWDGKKRRLPIWEQDLILKDAFQYSCVPCFQEVARKIGVERMNEYLKKLDYGNMIVDSNSIDKFWLEGESKITPNQQLDFIKRFYENKLPIADRTKTIMKRLLLIDSNEEYKLSGKTGWAIRNNNNVGWLVGYIEIKKNVYYIVTNIEPHEAFNMDLFPKIRTQISLGALKKLSIIK